MKLRLTDVMKGTLILAALAIAIGCGVASSSSRAGDGIRELAPSVEANIESEAAKGTQTAVFAGGCFWGVEAVYEHVKGVTDSRSGYSGGGGATANYDAVSEGKTEHAEAVKVTFDPAKVSYTQLLSIFFSVVHDPTQLNRQGPDVGPQYRSAIFYANEEQKKLAEQYIDAINKSKVFDKPVVTQVVPLKQFYDAEAYHQDYLRRNPDNPYIVAHDLPKLAALKEKFKDLYK
jgi:peptide-methionine (S)-S-oxide reductase